MHYLSSHVSVLLSVCRGYHHLNLVCTRALYEWELMYHPLKIMWYFACSVLGGAQSAISTHATTASRTDGMFVYIPTFQMHDMPAPDAGKRKSYLVVNDRDLRPPKSANL